MTERRRITVQGVVQGVGFRPCVHVLADADAPQRFRVDASGWSPEKRRAARFIARCWRGRYTVMGEAAHGRPVEILLVEDNAADVRLTVEALRESRVQNNMHVASDGVRAMSFLRREESYTTAPRPDLILLDLNLPRKDGREVLAEIKQDPDLRRIPVVILTTSEADRDILQAYNLHANCYIVKPLDVFEFIILLRGVEDFWFTIVRLAPK
jgi:CheY-like chemotaxis protein